MFDNDLVSCDKQLLENETRKNKKIIDFANVCETLNHYIRQKGTKPVSIEGCDTQKKKKKKTI